MVSLAQMVMKRLSRIFVDVSMSTFSISACMESMSAALPLFVALIAVLISTSVGGQALISRTLSAHWGLADSSGSGQLSTSWKCCTHLAVCLRYVSKALRADCLMLLPKMRLVILWMTLISPLAAVCSSSSASLSI